jgi:dolichol-phosphate mannosyltransferase
MPVISVPAISVIVPAYNEAATVGRVVTKVWNALRESKVQFEILAVDDGSSDATSDILGGLTSDLPDLRVVRRPMNSGKSAAVMAGISESTGTMIAIQDADDEYDPAGFLRAVVEEHRGHRRAVIASRMLGDATWANPWQKTGNRAFTRLLNRATGLSLTDALSGQKAWPRAATNQRELRSYGWGLDVRVTLMLLRSACPIREVPAIYSARQKSDGKKFGVRAYPSLLWPVVAWQLGLRRAPEAADPWTNSKVEGPMMDLRDAAAQYKVARVVAASSDPLRW